MCLCFFVARKFVSQVNNKLASSAAVAAAAVAAVAKTLSDNQL